MSHIEFVNPWFLIFLVLLPLLLLGRKFYGKKQNQALQMPSLSAFSSAEPWYKWVPPALYALRLLAISLLIVALARPRKVEIGTHVRADEGVDIMLVVDVSLSMLARDLKPTRLDALKSVAEDFVKKRPTDRIGIVIYSGSAINIVPLTTDKSVLVQAVRNLDSNEHLVRGTAIGVGLATAVNHLEHSRAKSKVVLLITDGFEDADFYDSEAVYISPQDASKIAREKQIKVYTIGIGTSGYVLPPIGAENIPQNKLKLDENLLKYIANDTKGLYFRATDNERLKAIYEEINQLEKSKISETKYYDYTEYYRTFVVWAFILLCIEIISRTLIFKQLTE
ncbi:VWA domain-containing protein [Ornithobacterium rhinotracheale]|uniref:VWA domain-containing protein n=1 Tax=Ornithobacterium rhinotracheale TaxID=28251 RepID=A0A410JPB8_ORNRH|nr:VWA domain-containing protein [Ornithobacterium rhinotracheale]QAR29888.1 VWA domain-containing protein [Ornithobacterium rhinotracheale]